jgi:Ser/Thr protein kinase RdoA (MazF antagonist)
MIDQNASRADPAALRRDIDADAIAAEASARWSGDLASLEPVSAGANFLYRLRSRGRALYLRITPPGFRTRSEIDGELAYLQHIVKSGTPAAINMPSDRGAAVEEIDSGGGTFLAVAFESISGESKVDGWSETQARSAGRLIARMHQAGEDFALPPGATRPDWRDDLSVVRRWLPPQDAQVHRLLDECEQWLGSLPKDARTFGVVHFDVAGDNVVWQGDTPVIIDFDDCMLHWHMADLARSLLQLRTQANGELGALEQAQLDGYASERKIDAQSRQMLDEFLRLTAIGDLAWELYRASATGDELDRDRLDALRRVIGAGNEVKW